MTHALSPFLFVHHAASLTGCCIDFLAQINLHFDPLVNFKLKQRLSLRGASVTLGMLFLFHASIQFCFSYPLCAQAWITCQTLPNGGPTAPSKTAC